MVGIPLMGHLIMNEHDRHDFSILVASTMKMYEKAVDADILKVWWEDLMDYSFIEVKTAFMRYRRSAAGGNFAPRPGSIISLLSEDCRPEASAAWAMLPQSERDAIVWTQEMEAAYFVAYPLMVDDGKDMIAARKAFIGHYDMLVTRARENRQPILWRLSRGFDSDSALVAIEKAIFRGSISKKEAMTLLPPAEMLALTKKKDMLALAHADLNKNEPLALENKSHGDAEKASHYLSKIKEMIGAR